MIPKALVLDFDGVVVKTPFEVVDCFERRMGVERGGLGWHGPFAPENDPLWRKTQRRDISERDYWALRADEATRIAGAPFPLSTRDLMNAIFAGPEDAFVRPEAGIAIANARAAGVTVAVLADDLAAYHGEDWFYSLTISKWIEHVVDTSLTGVPKPDADAYTRVLADIGVDSSDALYLDDQPRNVDGARRVGMQTLAFDVTRPADSFDAALSRFGISAATGRGRAVDRPSAIGRSS